MDINLDAYKNTFSHEISAYECGTLVYVTGVISKKWGRKDNGFGISIEDLTGSIIVSFRVSDSTVAKKDTLTKGKRVRIYATVADGSKKGQKILNEVVHVDLLEEINNEWSNEYDILEQEALFLISKVTQQIRKRLEDSNYTEVSTRIISRYVDGERLEPLHAVYPGYGSPAYLAPSPSAQLSEFLAVTLVPRVFTNTVSITQSYRFPNAASEIPIIMAKAINLDPKEMEMFLINTTIEVLTDLSEKGSEKGFTIRHTSGAWDDGPSNPAPRNDNEFLYSTYAANIPTIGKKWNSVLKEIRRLEDDQGNLLIECSDEEINDRNTVSTITFYPAQFLNWINKAPKRQLLNLWKLYDGRSVYD